MKGSSLTDEYFNYYNIYKKEYGEFICILMQIGSFYEMKMIKNEIEEIGNLDDICCLLNIQKTKSNKNIERVDRNNTYMAGFPLPALYKYLPILLENEYTVIVIDQNNEGNDGKISRQVSGIYSPSIQPLEIERVTNTSDNNLISIYIEQYSKFVNISIATINMTTNKFEIYDLNATVIDASTLDEIYRILYHFNIKELIVYTNVGFDKDFFSNYLELSNKSIHWYIIENKFNISMQNDFLKKVYNFIDFGLLQPIEYFDLEKYPLSIQNIISTIEFISKHDTKYINNLAIPYINNECQNLKLEMNTLQQLNILPNKNSPSQKYGSLFNVIDKTTTIIGKRGLRNLLCNPLKNVDEINNRYILSDQIEKLKQNELIELLSNICDLEKFHRKMSLKILQPYEFYTLHNSYINILKLFKLTQGILSNNSKELADFINEYTLLFNLEELKRSKFNGSEFYFNKGIIKELDIINDKIISISKQFEEYRLFFENQFQKTKKDQSYIKIEYTEQDGHFLSCTKIRGQVLEKLLKNFTNEHKYIFKYQTNSTKITFDKFKELSLDFVNNKELLCQKIKMVYSEKIYIYSNKYNSLFKCIINFVELLDISVSNIKCKNMYNYCKPTISNEMYSFLNAKQLRHPIIERVNENTKYMKKV